MYIRRIHQQHSSRVVNVPKEVMRRMEARTGSYVMFEEIEATGVFMMSKIREGAFPHGRDKGDPGKHD